MTNMLLVGEKLMDFFFFALNFSVQFFFDEHEYFSNKKKRKMKRSYISNTLTSPFVKY